MSTYNGSENDERCADRGLVTRVAIRNYKSIAACDVRPGPLSFLVGPNGSGKSNFLDALRFVADALRGSLGDALLSAAASTKCCIGSANAPPTSVFVSTFDCPMLRVTTPSSRQRTGEEAMPYSGRNALWIPPAADRRITMRSKQVRL